MKKITWLGIALLLGLTAGCQLDNWHYFIERERILVSAIPMSVEEQIKPHGEVTIDRGAKNLFFQITADFPDGEIIPDQILVDGRNFLPGTLCETGQHHLSITKTGYENLEGPFDIPTGFGNYTVVRQMVSKPRKLVLKIKDKATGEKIIPEKTMIGAQQVSDGSMVKPGETTLEIAKRGYLSIIEAPFYVAVGEGALVLEREMLPGKVELRFEFTDAKSGKQIYADEITLNEQATTDNSFVEPGSYKLTVAKQGYQTLSERLDVPQQTPYTVKKQLKPSETTFDWDIYGDYPPNIPIDPIDAVLLDGKRIEKGMNVSPGPHSIEVRQSAYETLRAKFTIPSGLRGYTYKATLTSMPRAIEISVRHDIAPPTAMSIPQVTMQNLESNQRFAYKGSEKVKPSTYEVLVEQSAYQSARVQKRIFPASFPFKIEVLMEAKERPVQAEILFDITPPANLDPHVITFVELGTNVRRVVRPGGSIRPGRYEYIVEKPGYQMSGEKKVVNIEPSEQAFEIREQMTADWRKVSFHMVDDKGVLRQPSEILIDNQAYSFEKTYRPGSYRVIAAFDKFQRVSEEFEIPPGVGPHTVSLKLAPK